ncbi:hypothetical protein SAMN05444353_1635 [Polaribacter dokdonensis DSW-5]|uniref:Uncharacterized protein n=1 Tax=Polaribacter dokdonensis DSW-5 TaxID=1300348 RepID=A0A1H5IRW1_9FLAO|nr:hypothetical protein SAMN05444353_1635 [Polaribacter dokdonensis DSW-5]
MIPKISPRDIPIAMLPSATPRAVPIAIPIAIPVPFL